LIDLAVGSFEDGHTVGHIVDALAPLNQAEVGSGVPEYGRRVGAEQTAGAVELPPYSRGSLSHRGLPALVHPPVLGPVTVHARNLPGEGRFSVAVIHVAAFAANPGQVHDIRPRIDTLTAQTGIKVPLRRMTSPMA
jgi:hypothetical protein